MAFSAVHMSTTIPHLVLFLTLQALAHTPVNTILVHFLQRLVNIMIMYKWAQPFNTLPRIWRSNLLCYDMLVMLLSQQSSPLIRYPLYNTLGDTECRCGGPNKKVPPTLLPPMPTSDGVVYHSH